MSSTKKTARSPDAKPLAAIVVFLLVTAAAGCAPQRPYRPLAPPVRSTAPAPQKSAPLPPPPPVESNRGPLPQDPRIHEQDLRTRAPSPPPTAKQTHDTPRQASIGETRTTPQPADPATVPPLPDDSSLLAKITPGVSPQRAASLRLTEEGRRLIDAGEPARALTPLERTIAVDSTNPYGYFYLAKAQFLLGRYQQSMNFLDVGESRLVGEPFWLAEVHALRGENFRALGQTQRAEISYRYALRLNSGNRTAAEALARMQAEAPSPSR